MEVSNLNGKNLLPSANVCIALSAVGGGVLHSALCARCVDLL